MPKHIPSPAETDDVPIMDGMKCLAQLKVSTRSRPKFHAAQFPNADTLAAVEVAERKKAAAAGRDYKSSNPLGPITDLTPSNPLFVELRDKTKCGADPANDAIIVGLNGLMERLVAQQKKVSDAQKKFTNGTGNAGNNQMVMTELRKFKEFKEQVFGLRLLYNLMFDSPTLVGVPATAWAAPEMKEAAALGNEIALGVAGKLKARSKKVVESIAKFDVPKELDATAARSRDYLLKRETAVRLAALHYVASMHGSGTDGALTDIDTVLPGSFFEVRFYPVIPNPSKQNDAIITASFGGQYACASALQQRTAGRPVVAPATAPCGALPVARSCSRAPSSSLARSLAVSTSRHPFTPPLHRSAKRS